LVAQVGIAGSTQTGDYVVMGGQVGVAGHLKIGDFAQLAAKAGVMTDVPAKAQYGGEPAVPLSEAKRSVLALMRLPDVMQEFRALQRRVAEPERRANTGS
jgi:UDP-3-O-[3-hydroxymyristoyl] glucosamine N-acyltransferase